MKKKKEKFFLVKGETWPYDVLVCLGATREEIFKHWDTLKTGALTEEDKKHLEMRGVGRTVKLSIKAFVLWTKFYPEYPHDYACLAHEIFHVVDMQLRSAGMGLCDDSDEAWAYQIDWLTNKIYSHFQFFKK